jgi:hypothetical protein
MRSGFQNRPGNARIRSVSWIRKKQSDPHSGTVPETRVVYGYYFLAPEWAGNELETDTGTRFGYGRRNSPEIFPIRPFPAVRDSPGYRFVTSFANSIRLYVYERKNSLDIAHSQHVTIHTCYVDENEAIPQPQFLRRHQMKFINQNSNYEDEVRYMLRIK